MKKFTTKLLMSIIAVAFAFVALGTSTYAWFAMNDVVTAQGMSITAKSDSTFLLIKAGENTAAQVQTGKLTIDSAPAATATAELYPVAHETISTITAADAVTSEKMTNWFYKTSDDPSLYGGEGHESAKQSIASADFNKYVLVNTFTLTIAEGGNSMSALKVKECTITTATGGDAAVKVLVATETNAQEFSATGTGSTVLQDSLDSNSTMVVKIYIYWDGADADVYTNGIADLKETSVVVTFTGTID